MNKILIAGGTGFVGKQLIAFLSEKGYDLSVLSRKKQEGSEKITYFQWDIDKATIDLKAFDGVDTIINLTGVNISEKRWTKKRKKEILASRTQSLKLLFKTVSENKFPIQTVISSSAVGYYGALTSQTIFDETSSKGDDFLATICSQWENEANQFTKIGARVVILRKGVIIGKGGGLIQTFAPIAKKGINPAVGSGKQYIPLIDMRDLLRLYEFLLSHQEVKGVFNAVSSQHITMNELAKTILSHLGKKKILPNAPSFVIRLLFGEMACMLLNGSRISNERIKQQGFTFLYDTLEKSLEDKSLLSV